MSHLVLPPRLYHGTSTRHLESILRNGICPRGRKRSVDKNWPSHPRRVYLSDAFAFKFGLDAMANKEGVVIFEVDTGLLPSWNFAADDDVVAEKLTQVDGMEWLEAVKKAAKVAKDYCPVGIFRYWWILCLRGDYPAGGYHPLPHRRLRKAEVVPH